MTAASHTPGVAFARSRGLLQRAWAFNRLLALTVLINLALVPVLLAAALFDPIVIAGANGWIKPLKFTLSIALYAGTLLWLLTLVEGRRWLVQIIATGTALALLAEIALITLQVARGTTSHFNLTTPFDAAVFSLMGVLITLVAVANLLLGIWLIFQRMPDPVQAWSVRLGVLITFVGMLAGYLMTSAPTPAQLAALQAGGSLTTVGAHSVGVPDGGPGLPLLGWSTTGGDLRVGHFVGLHAMQVLPLLGFALTRSSAVRRWNSSQRTRLVWLGGVLYLGLTLLVTWQALRGQPVGVPDVLTLGVAGAGLGVGALLLVAILTRARRPA